MTVTDVVMLLSVVNCALLVSGVIGAPLLLRRVVRKALRDIDAARLQNKERDECSPLT